MMTITYEGRSALYVNMTNRCPCACVFCLRSNKDHVFASDSLWLEREPTVKEVCDSIAARDLSRYEEIVFCGYGEPTERLEDLLQVAAFVKRNADISVRINTNGLSDLINGEPTAVKLRGLIDTVSISLNATNPSDYLRLVRPRFGEISFDAMLAFAKACTEYVDTVVMTMVDVVTSEEEQAIGRRLCESVGATFRIRPYESD